MNRKKAEGIILFLKNNEVEFDKGLTHEEFNNLLERFGLEFPPDLKLLLSIALPITPHFPNWRTLLDGSDSYIKESITHPQEGLLFDIEKNNFWYKSWGEKPKDLSEALEVARKELKHVPNIVRVYGHRYIPSEPLEAGNPIFSIVQTDIIYYGHDLENYFQIEFNRGHGIDVDEQKIKKIPFWSDLVS